MRKLKRSIARARMIKEGIRKMNKESRGVHPVTDRPVLIPSYFATNWKKYSKPTY